MPHQIVPAKQHESEGVGYLTQVQKETITTTTTNKKDNNKVGYTSRTSMGTVGSLTIASGVVAPQS